MPKLRPWQQHALVKALRWLLQDRRDHRFLINTAPGAGKTLASCVIARTLIEHQEIDRVVVIAPRAEVVSQWADDFRRVTGRYMSKVTGRDGDLHGLGLDVCATWAAIQGLQDALQALCRASRVLVICDEHHHAAVQAAWGEGADSAFTDARFALVLTGTPIRSVSIEDPGLSASAAFDSTGRAGAIRLTAPVIDLAGGAIASTTSGSGNAGLISLDVGWLNLREGSAIVTSSYGEGNAGDILISAGNVLIDGQGSEFLTGLFGWSSSAGTGGGVYLTIADTLTVQQGGMIDTSTFGAGNAGNVTITARNLLVDGQGSSNYFTGILSGAAPDSTGNGGGSVLKMDIV